MVYFGDFKPTEFDLPGMGLALPGYCGHAVCPVIINRDSNLLDLSNWEFQKKELKGEIFRFKHWACGWFEIMLIDPYNIELMQKAHKLESRLEDYPILDEMDYSEKQYNSVLELWESASIRDRIQYCKDSGISIFSARQKEIPEKVLNYCIQYAE